MYVLKLGVEKSFVNLRATERFFFANNENCKIRAVGTGDSKGNYPPIHILKGMKIRAAPSNVFGLFFATPRFSDLPMALKDAECGGAFTSKLSLG